MGRVKEISEARKARLADLLKLEVQRQQTSYAALSRAHHWPSGKYAAIVRGEQAVPLRLAEAILEQMGISDIETALGPEEEPQTELPCALATGLIGEVQDGEDLLARVERLLAEAVRVVTLLRGRGE